MTAADRRSPPATLLATRRRPRGISLPIALVALAGLSLAATAMMRSADSAMLVAGNLGFESGATKATDLAVERGIAAVRGIADPTNTLKSDNSAINYYASIKKEATMPPTSRLSPSTPAPVVDAATGHTGYWVVERLCDNDGSIKPADCVLRAGAPVYRLTALTIGPRNTTQTAQAFFTLVTAQPICSLLTQGLIKMSGTTYQNGNNLCWHSNAELDFPGGIRTAGLTLSTSGTINYSPGGEDLPAIEMPGAPTRVVPPVIPSAHKPYARQVFKSDGTVTGSGYAAGAWTFGSGTWKLATAALPPPGVYYFEGNVEMASAYGSAAAPAQMTMIIEGSLKISNQSHFTKFRDPLHPQATNDVFFLTAGDMQFTNKVTMTDPLKKSFLAVGCEFRVSNDLTIDSMVYARNDPNPPGAKNLADRNEITGTLTQNYDSGLSGSTAVTEARHRWRLATR